MLDKSMIGKSLPGHRVSVEKGRLLFFSKAIGETNPVYIDEASAKAAGYSFLPVPPSFLFCLEMESPEPYAWFAEVGLELPKVLHGEQNFTYHAMAYAGGTLTFEMKVADMYEKKGGSLEFLVKETRVTNQHGAHIADLRTVIVQRHG